jgi:hypothetical protein
MVVLSKERFFLLLFLLTVLLAFGPRALWMLHSRTTWGVFAFEGAGNAGDQISLSNSINYFRLGKDTILFTGMGNLEYCPGDFIPIRYQVDRPADAEIDRFIALWGKSMVFGGIPLVMLMCIFLHPGVVQRHAKLRLIFKKPFIQIVDNREMWK